MGELGNENIRARYRPFPEGIEEDSIAKVTVVETLNDVGWHTDTASWCPCAWSPDCMYIAYTCGPLGSLIKLQPWNKNKHCLLQTDRCDDVEAIAVVERTFSAGETVCCIAIGSSEVSSPDLASRDWFQYRYGVMDGMILAAGLRSGQIRLWRITECLDCKPTVLIDHTRLVSDIQFSRDGSMCLVSGSYDGNLKVWHLKDGGNLYPTLRSSDIDGIQYRKINAVAWSPNGRLVCGVGTSYGVFLWNMTTYVGQKLRAHYSEVRGHHHDVQGCDFSPDSALLVTCSLDTQVLIWDTNTGQAMRHLLHLNPPPSVMFAGGANGSYVRDVAFNSDGQRVTTICDDGLLRVWDIFGEDTPEALGHISDGLICRFSPHGASILVGSSDHKLHVVCPPLSVCTLRHLCRLALRRIVTVQDLDALHIHRTLILYLKYTGFDSETIPPLKEELPNWNRQFIVGSSSDCNLESQQI